MVCLLRGIRYVFLNFIYFKLWFRNRVVLRGGIRQPHLEDMVSIPEHFM